MYLVCNVNKVVPSSGVTALKGHHKNQGCNLQQSIRNSVAQIGIKAGLMHVLASTLVKKIIHPRNASYSVKRAIGRSSQKHDNFESRVRLSHWSWTCLKRGKISSFTFAFPSISIHMKSQGIVRVPAGPFRCPINYFLLCFNRPKCPEMQRISYSDVERATAEHVARGRPVGQTSPPNVRKTKICGLFWKKAAIRVPVMGFGINFANN